MVVQETKRQEENLEELFKDMASYNMGGRVWFVVILMEIFAGALFCIPYQEAVAKEMSVIPSLFAIQGPLYYIDGYVRFTEKRKVCYVYDKIKYLPISRAVLVRWRMKKLLGFCGKTTMIFVGLQLLFAWVSFGNFSLDNILYPVIIGFMIPMSVCGYFCCRK